MDQELNYEQHFNIILKKCYQRLYFLRVLKKTHTKKELWLVYNTLIRSTIESLIHKIENLQIRAHYIICGDIKKCKCKLESLEERRKKSALHLFQKVVKTENHLLHTLLPVSFHNRFILPHCNFNNTRHSFLYQCICDTQRILIE